MTRLGSAENGLCRAYQRTRPSVSLRCTVFRRSDPQLPAPSTHARVQYGSGERGGGVCPPPVSACLGYGGHAHDVKLALSKDPSTYLS